MSYNKKTWANGDLITKESMNNIENGIYSAHDELEKANRKIEENTTDSNTSKQDISDIKTEIGTEELTTNAKNIKAAINEHDSQIRILMFPYKSADMLKENNAFRKFREQVFKCLHFEFFLNYKTISLLQALHL